MAANTFMGLACETGPHNGTGCIRYSSNGMCVEALRAYAAAHKDERANYRATHKDEIAKQHANYRATHKDEIAKRHADYRATHKDEIAKRQADYNIANKDEIAKRHAEQHATIEGRAKKLLNGARSRAKKKNIDFNLTLEWIIEQLKRGMSPLSGKKFSYELPPHGYNNHPLSPSIDKIDSKKGYTQDNCRIITTYENTAISEYGLEFTEAYWQAVFAYKEGTG